MKLTFGLLRTGSFAAAIILAVATVTVEFSVAQETSAGDEKSSNTKPLIHLLEKLYPKLRLEVHPVGEAVLLRGTVESVEIRRQLIEIADQFFPKVLEQLRVQPAARSAVDLSKTDADQIVQIGDDRQGIRARLRTLFPNAKLEINFANDAVILRGQVARSEDIKPIINVAEQYFPKVLDYIIADGQPPGAGRAWQSGNPEYPEILTQGVRTNRVAAVVERLKAEFGNRITVETKKLSEDAESRRTPFNLCEWNFAETRLDW